jgi:hypothetical protein
MNPIINCEIKTNNPNTLRLSKSSYDRPNKTLTDTLQSNSKMKEKLINYERVDDIDDVPINTHVRYVTLKDGSQRFCLGGFLTRKHSKYVVLSNGKLSWSVQRYHWLGNDKSNEPDFETIFFRILSKEDKQNKIIEKQQNEILKLKQFIENN